MDCSADKCKSRGRGPKTLPVGTGTAPLPNLASIAPKNKTEERSFSICVIGRDSMDAFLLSTVT